MGDGATPLDLIADSLGNLADMAFNEYESAEDDSVYEADVLELYRGLIEWRDNTQAIIDKHGIGRPTID